MVRAHVQITHYLPCHLGPHVLRKQSKMLMLALLVRRDDLLREVFVLLGHALQNIVIAGILVELILNHLVLFENVFELELDSLLDLFVFVDKEGSQIAIVDSFEPREELLFLGGANRDFLLRLLVQVGVQELVVVTVLI